MRVIFLGTPEFAVPTLEALIDHREHQVLAVLCQPDRPAGRGNKLHQPPTKVLAAKNGIAVLQPEKLSKSPETVEAMKALDADVIVMVAFGQILKKSVLTLTKYGVINVHGSLLPRYRGAAPINWAIINGEKVTGITTMITEAGVDTGPMLLKKEVTIDEDMTSEDLALQMSQVGAALLIETLDRMVEGKLEPIKQNDADSTLAPMMNKETGRINWSLSASDIHNLVRGLLPWPSAFTTHADNPLKIWQTKLTYRFVSKSKPGTVFLEGEKVGVSCGDGTELLELLMVQPPNKAKMTAPNWANGARLKGGELLGDCEKHAE